MILLSVVNNGGDEFAFRPPGLSLPKKDSRLLIVVRLFLSGVDRVDRSPPPLFVDATSGPKATSSHSLATVDFVVAAADEAAGDLGFRSLFLNLVHIAIA